MPVIFNLGGRGRLMRARDVGMFEALVVAGVDRLGPREDAAHVM